MTDSPRASVIIPVYNGERYLAEAIRSVRAQTLRPLEIIVVDDGSTDATPQVIADLAVTSGVPVCAIRQPNCGPAAARNRGLELAQGDLIAFLDADDWWPETSLSRRADCLLRHPELAGVIGATQLMVEVTDAPGRPPAPWGVPQPSLNLGGALIRRSAFDQVGVFDEAFAYAEDADWLLRAREAGLRFGVHPAVALMARRHANNMTNQTEPSGAYLAQALRRSLARRQQHAGNDPDQLLNLPDLVRCDD